MQMATTIWVKIRPLIRYPSFGWGAKQKPIWFIKTIDGVSRYYLPVYFPSGMQGPQNRNQLGTSNSVFTVSGAAA